MDKIELCHLIGNNFKGEKWHGFFSKYIPEDELQCLLMNTTIIRSNTYQNYFYKDNLYEQR